jgi:hypothetical protein
MKEALRGRPQVGRALQTAQELGIEVLPNVCATADEVID